MSSPALGRLLLDRADDDRAALLYQDRRWSYRELVVAGLPDLTGDARNALARLLPEGAVDPAPGDGRPVR